MKTKKGEDAKQRIHDAAMRLFARKGYDAVGVREIAEEAGVQLSMINYYFGGKFGLLKSLLEEYHKLYFEALGVTEKETLTAPERVRISVRNLIELYRTHTELAIAAMKTSGLDIPEMHEMQARSVAQRRQGLNEHFARLGLDTDNAVQMSVVRGLLTTLITAHFEAKFTWEQMFRSSKHVRLLEKQLLHEPEIEYDDAYYQRFGDMLTDLYLYGVTGMAERHRADKTDDRKP